MQGEGIRKVGVASRMEYLQHRVPTPPGGAGNAAVMERKRNSSGYPSSSATVMFLSAPSARLKEEWGWPCPAACLQGEGQAKELVRESTEEKPEFESFKVR